MNSSPITSHGALIEGPIDPVTEAFGGSGEFDATAGSNSITGSLAISARFTGANTFEGTVDLQVAVNGNACTEIHETVVSTRQ